MDEQLELFSDLKPKRDHGRVLNWRPSLPDHRDAMFLSICPAEVHLQPRPTAVDLRALCSEVFDQGEIGSCSGQALAAAIEFLELQQLKIPGSQAQEYSKKFESVSRLFIYWNERVIEGTTQTDAGATTLRDGCISLNQKGVCRESLWPYDGYNLFKAPPAKAYKEAGEHRLALYYKLHFQDIFTCLSVGFPVVFGIPIYQSFMSDEVAKTGLVPAPGWFMDPQVGGHALMIVGYDDSKKNFIVRNSWGTSWGDSGYCYLPYAYIQHQGSDFFTLRFQ